jgi:hypothetical protein
MENDIFICDCEDIEHQLVVSRDVDEKELILSIHLSQYQNFFQRILVAIKYVFGKKSIYGAWDIIILNEKNMIKLKNLIEKELNKSNEQNGDFKSIN